MMSTGTSLGPRTGNVAAGAAREEAAGLSPSAITRLTSVWQEERETWSKWSLNSAIRRGPILPTNLLTPITIRNDLIEFFEDNWQTQLHAESVSKSCVLVEVASRPFERVSARHRAPQAS